MNRLYSLFLSLSFSTLAWAQPCFPLPEGEISRIQRDLEYLASEELQGRAPGTEGLLMARDYLTEAMAEMGLKQMYGAEYQQELTVPAGIRKDTIGLEIENKWFGKEETDYYPLQYSADGQVQGETEYVGFGLENSQLGIDELDDEKLKDRIAVVEAGLPKDVDSHSHTAAAYDLFTRLKSIASKEVKAILVVAKKGKGQEPKRDFDQLNSCGVPVMFLTNPQVVPALKRGREVALSVQMEELTHTVHNVVGYLDRGAPTTIVIGAHYDHLGMGEANSLYRGEPAVHHGADDNASGTAGLLALARSLKNTDHPRLQRHNFLFTAFTAEEMGLLGSNYFTENLPDGLDIQYMLNMDMIGRMEENQLQINGTGTSPRWEKLLHNIQCQTEMVFSPGGIGPSDHSNFYNLGIPVLHFFTGTHEDYHKPTDVADKINYQGLRQTLEIMLTLIAASSADEDFPYSKTKTQSMDTPSFSVTLGVMPDYMYQGNGMRIDGISEDRPAQEAGFKKGDVVVKMGSMEVSDMQSYMRALGQFEKGEKAQVTVKRGKERITKTVQF